MRKLAWFAASCSAAVFLAVYVLPEGALVPLGEVCALAALAAVGCVLWQLDWLPF